MEHVLEILRHSESVLAKKIKGLKDGKPKWAANEQMTEIRMGINIITKYSDMDKHAMEFGVYLLTNQLPAGLTIEQKYDDFLVNRKQK